MDGVMLGVIGGVVGSLIGIAGAAFGTWNSYRQAKSDAERRYVLTWSGNCMVFVAAFLLLLFWLPEPYRWLLFIPYPLALTWGIFKCNADITRLRAEAEASAAQAPGEPA